MRGQRRGDDDGPDVRPLDEGGRVVHDVDAGKLARCTIAPLGAGVGNGDEPQAVGVGKVSRQVGAPVSKAHQANVQHQEKNSAIARETAATDASSRNGCIGSESTSAAARSDTGKSP